MSQEMLHVLEAKYADKEVELFCGSYFDLNLGKEVFDYALSTYSLHHFSETEKLSLYKKLYTSLRDGGCYVEGDYTCKTKEQQHYFLAENERLRKENGITDGCYHYDTPFTAECQIKLLKAAGFYEVALMKEWENTSIIVARK
jgi:tRNA (cmo5U34)-methyltransferase